LTAQGHPRAIFKRAIERGNVTTAEAAAREFALSLEEALQLVLLYAAYEPATAAGDPPATPTLGAMPEYLLELHWKDGRIEPRPGGEYKGWSPIEIGAEVEVDDVIWRIRDVVPEAGYEAKVVLDEA
jgi:hypothetical protein